MARAVELNRDKILEKAAPEHLDELASVLCQLDPQAFRYEIEYICGCLNLPPPRALLANGYALGSAHIPTGHLPDAAAAARAGIQPGSLASTGPPPQFPSGQPQAQPHPQPQLLPQAQAQPQPRPLPQTQPHSHAQALPHISQHAVSAPPPGFPGAHQHHTPPAPAPGPGGPFAPHAGMPGYRAGLLAQQMPVTQTPKPHAQGYAVSVPQSGTQYHPAAQYGTLHGTQYGTQHPAPAPQFSNSVVPRSASNITHGAPQAASVENSQHPTASSLSMPHLQHGNSGSPFGIPATGAHQSHEYTQRSTPSAQTSPVPASSQAGLPRQLDGQGGTSGSQGASLQGQPGTGTGPRAQGASLQGQTENAGAQPQSPAFQASLPASQSGSSGSQPGTGEVRISATLGRPSADASEGASGGALQGTPKGAMDHGHRKRALRPVPGSGWHAGAKVTCLAVAAPRRLISADEDGAVTAWLPSGAVSHSWNASPLFVSAMDSLPGTSTLVACAWKKGTKGGANWILHLGATDAGEWEERARVECRNLTCIKVTSAAVMTGEKDAVGAAVYACQYEVLGAGALALVRKYDQQQVTVSALSASRSDDRVFLAGRVDNTVRVYDTRQASCAGTLGTPSAEVSDRLTEFVTCVDGANGYYVVSGSWVNNGKGGAVRLWDIRGGCAPVSDLSVASPVMQVAVGTSIACVACSSTKQLGLLDWTVAALPSGSAEGAAAPSPSVAYLEAPLEEGGKPRVYRFVKWGEEDCLLYAAGGKNLIDSFMVGEE